MAQEKEQGVELVGPNGLLNQLTKNVLETALDAEMAEWYNRPLEAVYPVVFIDAGMDPSRAQTFPSSVAAPLSETGAPSPKAQRALLIPGRML